MVAAAAAGFLAWRWWRNKQEKEWQEKNTGTYAKKVTGAEHVVPTWHQAIESCASGRACLCACVLAGTVGTYIGLWQSRQEKNKLQGFA